MKKCKYSILALICLVSVCLFSCGNKIPTDRKLQPYVVVSIDKYDFGGCVYSIETGTDYVEYIDELKIVDSIGKFEIGDSVYVSLNKR